MPPSKIVACSREEILCEFDKNQEYGPHLDISRHRRWLRAEKFGLNPSKVVLQYILEIEQEQINKKSTQRK